MIRGAVYVRGNKCEFPIIPHFICELLSVCNDTSYASWTRKEMNLQKS